MFVDRRKQLVRSLNTESNSCAAIFVSNREMTRNSDVLHEFRQESNFYYLSGFDEPDSIILIRPNHPEEYIMFVRPHDPEMAIWVGPRAGIDGVQEFYGAHTAFSIDTFPEKINELLSEVEDIYYGFGSDQIVDEVITNYLISRQKNSQRGLKGISALKDPRPMVEHLRMFKSDNEIKALKEAINITAQGFQVAQNLTKPELYEFQIQAALESEFRRLGSSRNGYPSIVASGHNSCILHYTTNQEQLKDGNLLLIDAGAEYDYYTADITRTWPINGRFSASQRCIYDVVLEAQRVGIELAKPGVTLEEIHYATLEVLVRGLVENKILTGSIDTLIEERKYQAFYMHSTSHWLGMDVHDVGNYRNKKDPTPLKTGMCFTVEPGLYLSAENHKIPEEFRGIGIRIEDNILITNNSYVNLSKNIPSSPEKLEQLIGITAN
ncbi:MAG: aminopeptidase P N-terminal domain-containing protein [Dehalococcoidia bacterium]|nr:aminopeptidase P N-terminal domain-containing protein [Dehalococcoidia bacterium]